MDRTRRHRHTLILVAATMLLAVADVRNIAGRFVTPSPENVAEAAEDMSLASAGDLARSLLYT